MLQPILVFDSGVGGLSVVKELRAALPERNYIYLFDNARLPYGDLADDELISGCVGLITAMVDKVNPALVIIACNTASTLVLPALRSILSIPVVGVVPAIKPAAHLSKTKEIGLLATPGTIKRAYTNQLIQDFAPNLKVHLFGSSELVLMVEAKIAGYAVNYETLKQLLAPILTTNLDVLVLGCTHFPLLEQELTQCLGEKYILLDSAKAIAKRAKALLQQESEEHSVLQGKVIGFYTSKDLTVNTIKGLAELGVDKVSHFSPALHFFQDR